MDQHSAWNCDPRKYMMKFSPPLSSGTTNHITCSMVHWTTCSYNDN